MDRGLQIAFVGEFTMEALQKDGSVTELFKSFSDLIQSEARLAKAELFQETREARNKMALRVAGFVLAWLGAQLAVATVVMLLGIWMGDRYWLSALLIGVLMIGAGSRFLFTASKGSASDGVRLPETLASLREDQALLARQFSLNRSRFK